jgi:hypothetical protein
LDSTNAFTKDGEISFTCPKIEETEINGKKSNWIRVRITGGDYGKEAFYQEQTEIGRHKVFTIEGVKKKVVDGEQRDLENEEKTEWVYIPSTFKPPSILSLSLKYSFSSSAVPEILLTYNDFTYQDQTNICETEEEYFMPFQKVSDEDPTLYLGFDQDIRNLPVTTFFPFPGNIFASYQKNPPIIVWDYWAGDSWSPLNAEDNTVNFTRQEMVQFIAPSDMAKRNLFGEEHYWVRVRLAQGDYEIPPKLSAIYTNTVWAYNVISVSNEVLGSSNGKPGQVFKFSHFPVLPGQAILVLENTLTEEDRKTILSEEGKDAITEKTDDAGNVIETWVRWHEVEHFYFSEPNSRHYMIDRNKGLITFGDAQKCMIPPFGKDNIKCSRYQYGGGKKGNVKAETITQLKTTFPYVDSVANPEAADGGADQENLDMARIRGPQTIKHRDRAVTSEDFEWLVREASSKVFKVKCMPATGLIPQSNPENENGKSKPATEKTTADLSLRFKQGSVTIIIVPESEEQKPFPSQELIREIEEYLLTRISTCLTTPYTLQINLMGPGYIRMGAEASVRFRSIREAKKIEGRIIENLKQFFHPLYGGPEKKGWDFGRNIYISEVYEVIENTEGVDYVEKVSLNASAQIYKLTVTEKLDTSVPYPKHSRVTSEKEKGELIFSLAERFPKGDERDILTVIGFKEGDCIILSNENNSLRIVLESICCDVPGSICGDVPECKPISVLECEPIWTNVDFPVGSIVETTDRRIKSYIIKEIPAQSNLRFLKVAIFEERDIIVLRRYVNAPPSEELIISTVTDQVETIFIEDNYLVYSGTHEIKAINVAG